MLKLHELKPYKNSSKRRKTVGRGVGSGHGTFSGRGAKGQKARAGSSIPVGFEGGRMPLQRQIPKKRGFTSRQPKAFVLGLGEVARKFSASETVNKKTLIAKSLADHSVGDIKILGKGEIDKPLVFESLFVSKAAAEKITKAGGRIENKKQETGNKK